jgi:hypothetical protein
VDFIVKIFYNSHDSINMDTILMNSLFSRLVEKSIYDFMNSLFWGSVARDIVELLIEVLFGDTPRQV